jgi:phosphatidate cytidylyltransferase
VGGYIFGSWLGKNLIAPRISPKKTWEGYIAGVLVSVAGSPLLILMYRSLNLHVYEAITIQTVTVLAVVLSVFSIVGDLLISLIKRYFGEKDTGKILPGHGGMLDRMDSWIWVVAIGYYLISVIILS